MFKPITLSVSLVAAMAAFPSLLPGVVSEKAEIDKEAVELIGQLEEVARDVHYNADRLGSFKRNPDVSKWTHYHHLDQIKSLVNDGLRPALDRLTALQPELTGWQQEGIDKMLQAARALASDTNAAILSRNEAGSRSAMLDTDYRELLDRINGHAEELVRTSDAAGAYAAALEKASEAGLRVADR